MAVNYNLTDSKLMQRVANYDSKALETLYDRYSPLLYTMIKKIVSDKNLAEEVLIDVFAIIWRKIELYDSETDNAYSWLVGLTRNKAVDVVRRNNDQIENIHYSDEYENRFIIPKISKEIDPLDLETALSISGNVENALNNLTDAQQYVIYLAYYEGLTQQQISAKLNIPFQTVVSKIKIASKNLRENLLSEGEE
ncbi:MAG: sigma-70 family RNA polymerase sigma factor [Bacteroidetes bacterium]|nr:sigma-70 family RNA polymerase sigma factor [Bacteroidota bacterium]MCH8941138.1 sigma-70 family RNA polymerase sigma factor [Bacteroidota bacterium]